MLWNALQSLSCRECAAEERKAIERKLSEFKTVFPESGMLTSFEASLAMLCIHLEAVRVGSFCMLCDLDGSHR